MFEIDFYNQVMSIMSQPPVERHRHLLRLHFEAVHAYKIVLGRLTAKDVQCPLPDQSDHRTIAEIVGHIAAWDRFAIQSAGDILVGITHPRLVTDLSGYREIDGTYPTIDSIDDFNEYHDNKYQHWTWDQLRNIARDTSDTLYALFAHPQLISAKRLEQTEPYSKRLKNGLNIENITMGWNLWLTMIEHLAEEHSALIKSSKV